MFRKRLKVHPISDVNDNKHPETKTEKTCTFKQVMNSLLMMFLFVVFYPLIPILTFIKILLKNEFETRELNNANEMSLIFVAIESSLQTIFTLWLILRGIIR